MWTDGNEMKHENEVDVTEVKKCRNGVKNISCQNANYCYQFFIILDCLNDRKALFYLKALLGNNFPQFDKNPGKYIIKTSQVETKPVSKYSFFTKILVNTTALKTQEIISQSMMVKQSDQIQLVKPKHWRNTILSIFIYAFQGADVGPLPHKRWNSL